MPDPQPQTVEGADQSFKVDAAGLGTSTPNGKQQGKTKAPAQAHTAVVYFHGMGSQRRHEEISRLIDCLDKYAYANQNEVGRIAEIRPKVEVPRPPIKDDVVYVSTKRVMAGKRLEARFYEVYWAPLTAGGVPSLQVLRWLLRQIPHPVAAIRTPWRLRARLRRSSLLGFWRRTPDAVLTRLGLLPEDLTNVLLDYDAFEGPDQWRDYAKGSFRNFLTFLRAQPRTVERNAAAVRLSKLWWVLSTLQELAYLAVLVTIGLTAVLVALASAFAVVSALKFISGSDRLPALLSGSPMLEVTFKNVLGICVFIASVLGAGSFLRNYLGDVQVWTTYEETDEKYKKRKEILVEASGMLQHVLRDEDCNRVIVVAHSLGTTVALDALLELNRYNIARPGDPLPLDKIDLFITMGSPIDKVHYFFESLQGKYHRYNRITDELRGDLGTPPFAKNRKPAVHWINFWDQADLVSGSLETPSNRQLLYLAVDNCQIASLGFPVPGKSHSAYFEHRDVLRILFEAIYDARYSFRNAKLVPKKGYDYAGQMVGKGSGLARTRIYFLLVMTLPWVGVALLAAVFAGHLYLRDLFGWVLLGLFVVLVVGVFVGKPWRHRLPVCPAPKAPAGAAHGAGVS